MHVRNIEGGFTAEDMEAAVRALQQGELVIAPTDTLYGLFANALDAAAVQKIYRLKARPADAPLPLIFGSKSDVAVFTRLTPGAEVLADAFWPGPLSLVLEAKSAELLAAMPTLHGTVAVRVPDHPFCRQIARELGGPVTATSANRSGRPPATRVAEIAPELLRAAAVVFDDGVSSESRPSTIAKIDAAGKIQIIRQGPISLDELTARFGVKCSGT